MIDTGLILPNREEKPRSSGITVLIDNGIPINSFKDTILNAASYVDFVKFGWGTSIVTKQLEEKLEFLKENSVDFFFGGTLFEKFLSQRKVEQYHSYCIKHGCKYVEISNGTLDLTNREKTTFITDFSTDFLVFSEVGSKDTDVSENQNPSEWVEWIQEDIEAGAQKVITEARESGTSGVCKTNGELRFELIDRILASTIDLTSIIFEAPNKKMQTAFIKRVGPNVNLANIPFHDCISLETLRLGLRSDTFHIV